jgi:hypothetical protein
MIAMNRGLVTLGAAATIAAAALTPVAGLATVCRAFLFAGDLWMGLALGAAGLLASWHILGGRWGRQLYPELGGLAATMPLPALAWLAVLPVLDRVFPWAAGGGEHAVAAKLPYLNEGFFALRTILYLLLWCVGAWLLGFGPRPPGRARPAVGAAVAIVLAVTATFASTDWILSLEPKRDSAGFGLVAMASCTLAAFCLAVRVRAYHQAFSTSELQTFSQILLCLLIVWVYFAFFEYLVAWSGDLPADAAWYDRRGEEPWGTVAWIFCIVGTIGPFFALLSSRLRQSAVALRAIASCVVLGQALFAAWLILPDVAPSFDAAAVAVLIAIALACFGLAFSRYWVGTREVLYG